MASAASAALYDIVKFNGTNDFGLWRIKMKALLGNLGLDEAIETEKKLPENITDEQKKEISDHRKEINKKAFNTLILSLGDKVLKESV